LFKQSMSMRHMTGKSQWTHLRCCKIPKSIDNSSLGGMGLSEPVSILRRGRRKTRLLASMGLQLRDIQVLLLVLMVVAAPFLRCAAAAGGMVPRTRMATPAADEDPLVPLFRCFPTIVLGGLRTTYSCEAGNLLPFSDSRLVFSFFTPARYHEDWITYVNPGIVMSLLEFTPGDWVLPGRWDSAISIPSGGGFSYVTVTTTVNMDFMMLNETEANFSAPSPYYGMGVSLALNLPGNTTASDYMLVRSSNDCRYTTTSCTDSVGCYRMPPPGHLPPPGEYWLCVTSNGWNDKYLPWGAESLETKMLLVTPLYLTAGRDKNVVVQDPESVASVPGRVFLVRCPGNVCPLVTAHSGEKVVRLDACVNPSVSSRVYLSDLRVLSAEAGVYAVCVDDDGEYTAPAALPV
ncbi:hypothetical protein DQ04_21521000, partial [Trypanosoma grayi]|uniref:hypothetical protein n=1 Tax=Trypanosoma grayi TaxID=71804 RepID=UPI0004F4B183